MFVFSKTPSIANQFLAEMRDVNLQSDSMRFRKNLERLGELLAYEVSKTLSYKSSQVQTPLGTAATQVIAEQPVLATILRAGLPMFQGFLNLFDKAESAFIGAYRGEHNDDNSFDIVLGYTATPQLDNKVLILIDPMLATGKSLVSVYNALMYYGKPYKTCIVSAIASKAGIAFVEKHIPDLSVWVGDIDPELNDKSYIVPGLGDAGDLAFGNKH